MYRTSFPSLRVYTNIIAITCSGIQHSRYHCTLYTRPNERSPLTKLTPHSLYITRNSPAHTSVCVCQRILHEKKIPSPLTGVGRRASAAFPHDDKPTPLLFLSGGGYIAINASAHTHTQRCTHVMIVAVFTVD